MSWNLTTYINRFQARDWINKKISENNTAVAWVYHVTRVTPNKVQAIEFQRVTPTGFIRVANSQVITLSSKGYHQIKVLSQERHGAPLRVIKELPSLTKCLPFLDFRIWLHWWASLGPGGMALASLLPNGGLSILWLLRKVGLSKHKETHLECEHLLFHSKVKPSKLHHHINYGQNLA